MNEPEKLTIWDRIFNRYRTVIVEQGTEIWTKFNSQTGADIKSYSRDFVRYKKIDRVTGSETIILTYLN